MSKIKRQKDILRLISNTKIKTQEELTTILKKMGYKVTQATISRDINELGLIKDNINGKSFYAQPLDPRLEKLASIFSQSVLSINYSHNIVVVKTIEGSANSSAALIDYIKHPQILGSVAGDDTIIVIIKDINEVKNIIDILQKYITL